MLFLESPHLEAIHLRSLDSFDHIYIYREAIDCRKQSASLALLVEKQMKLDPFSEYLFVFTNKSKKQIRMLYWDKSGFALWIKKLEKERFK